MSLIQTFRWEGLQWGSGCHPFWCCLCFWWCGWYLLASWSPLHRCFKRPKSKDFWPTVKPFLSNKGIIKDLVIILSENDNIISNQISVANILNEFVVNAAQDISSVLIPNDILNHPSIQTITDHIPVPTAFDFIPVTSESIYTFISKSNSRKATGVDGIPAKIIKSCSKTISEPLAKLINHSFATSAFPNRLKEAQVIPVYKKKDPLDKQNYRPISILPFISKLFEKAINSRLSTHFWEYVQPFPRCFQAGHGVSVHSIETSRGLAQGTWQP